MGQENNPFKSRIDALKRKQEALEAEKAAKVEAKKNARGGTKPVEKDPWWNELDDNRYRNDPKEGV